MIGRFQVMALLQAARAKVLGYPLDEAQSFGLNRAIFYAAAKRGFKGRTGAKHPGEQYVLQETPSKSITTTLQQDTIGNEIAYYVELEGKKRYVMGEEETSPRPASHIPFLSIGLKTSPTLSGQPKPGKMLIRRDLCFAFQ